MRFSHENDYDQYVAAAAARYGVPGALLKAIVGHESNWIAGATNNTGGDATRGGSFGLAQLSYQTAQALGYKGAPAGLLDPETNLMLAARYLGDLLRDVGQHGYGVDSAISRYNAGDSPFRPGDGPRVGINQAPPATAMQYPFSNQAYVDDVLDLYSYYLSTGASADAPAYALGAQDVATTQSPSRVVAMLTALGVVAIVAVASRRHA